MARWGTEGLARASSRRPWVTVALWAALVLGAGVASARFLGEALTTKGEFTSRPESVRGAELLEERLRGPERDTEFVIVRSDRLVASDPAFRREVERLRDELAGLGPGVVTSVVSPYEAPRPGLVSRDGRAVLLPVVMAGSFDQATEAIDDLHAVTDRWDGRGGFEVLVAGPATLTRDFNDIAQEDLRRGESVGVLAALVVLVVVFGALVAALVPVALALVGIAAALGAVALLGRVFDFSFLVTNMVTMMGLAVTVDYSLFILSRYREERRRGLDRHQAIAAAGATASRAVLFSGLTVVLALLGMLIVPVTVFRSLAAGAILVVVAGVAASLTLLPAVLALLGDRVDAVRVFRGRRARAAATGGFWTRVAHAVMRRPVLSLVLAAGLLVVGSLSYVRIETGNAGVSTLPDTTESRRAFTVLSTQFAGGLTTPIEVVVDGDAHSPAVRAAVGRLQELLAGDGGFGPSTVQTNAAGDLTVISVPTAGDPSGEAAVQGVARIRQRYAPQALAGVPAEVLVTGQPAFNKDFFDLTDSSTPVVFAFVLGLSFVLLTVVFRSVVVPLKAIVMNLLSVGAAYGLVVLVFQRGGPAPGRWVADLLGFRRVEAIEAWLPLFLFSVLFGLSMDYHVFLLSRIRERFLETGDNAESVAHGLARTGGIITGAAVIMVAVFGGFATGDLVAMQQFGFGLAVAVLLDATVVRSVLVPAAMKLLGDRNWYLPRWLSWLPSLDPEGPRPTEGSQPPVQLAGAR